MATETIRIGKLVIEKTIPDPVEDEAPAEVKVKPVEGHEAKEAAGLEPGTSARIARGAVRAPSRR